MSQARATKSLLVWPSYISMLNIVGINCSTSTSARSPLLSQSIISQAVSCCYANKGPIGICNN